MKRRATREVRIGRVVIGGERAIAIQSMTTTDPCDVEASARQAEAIARAGAAIVRLTVPSVKAAEALGPIRDLLRSRGINAPLVADVHYTPNAALTAADFVEKVRINPGNFADRRERARPGESFEEGRARVADLFGPLVERLKERDGALRIGVNHGSLSERITARFGDSPEGMVESALEYIEVCERLGYDRIVVSLKSSIPAVTVAANRLFAARVDASGGRYPLHIGVTEAGSGDEGQVRSAAGIGALLQEGLGDTIRVSLTEDPVKEIPAARTILEIATRVREERVDDAPPAGEGQRQVAPIRIGGVTVGGAAPVAVAGVVGDAGEPPDLLVVGAAEQDRTIEVGDAPEAGTPLISETHRPDVMLPSTGPHPQSVLFSFPGEDIDWERADRAMADAAAVPIAALDGESAAAVDAHLGRLVATLPRSAAGGAVVAAPRGDPADLVPALEQSLAARGLDWPVLIIADGARGVLETTIALAPPLLDGLGHALYVRGAGKRGASIAWDILQGTRRRITRVEYISCPSCGRTLFDLEEVTARIRTRTSHLKDVKIAIMGCIVNGPGEMADADFGYVGSGPGKIDLYVGSERVEKSIVETEAVDRLVDLIRSHGRWIDP